MPKANVILAVVLGLLNTGLIWTLEQGVAGATVPASGLDGANDQRGQHQQLQRLREDVEDAFGADDSVRNTSKRGKIGSGGGDDGDDVDVGLSSASVNGCSARGGVADLCRKEEGARQPEHQYHEEEWSQIERESSGIAVSTGEQDGIHIEFVGAAKSTVPGSDLPQPPTHPRDSSTTSEGISPLQHLPVDLEMSFEVLRCEGHGVSSGNGGLTVEGVRDHMFRKLFNSIQQAKSAAFTMNNEEDADAAPEKGSTGSDNVKTWKSSWVKALEAATAPLSYLFGTVGRVPGWFSDAVFEVRVKDYGVGNDLSQRLLLVQDPPRTLRLACSALSTLLFPPAEPSAASSPASATSKVARMFHTVCRTTSLFPGKEVSRPCQVKVVQSRGWMSTVMQTTLSLFRPGSVGNGDRKSGDTSEVCKCAEGGQGPCIIRVSPGREPCLYLEVDDATKRGDAFGPGSIEASSLVKLRTFPLAMPSVKSQTRTNHRQENGGGREILGRIIAALQPMVAGWTLPTSIAVPTFPARLLGGFALLFVAEPLSESRVFHYMLSAMLGALIGAFALIVRELGNPRRALLRMLLVVGLVTWLAVAIGDWAPSPAELLSRLPSAMLAIWSDGFLGYPSGGKVFFGASAVVGIAITRWYGLFLDEGEGSRGSWTNGRMCIRRLLTLSGVVLLYHGVSDAEIGVVLVVLALSAPSLAHLARRYSMWTQRSKWYRAGRRLCEEEYEEEGEEYTRQALAALRLSTIQDYSQIKKLKNQASRKRMAAFARTGEHYDSPMDEDNGGQNCSLM